MLNVAGTVGFNGPALTLPAGDYQISLARSPDGDHTAFNYQGGQTGNWQWRIYLGGDGTAGLEPLSADVQVLDDSGDLGILAGGSEAVDYTDQEEAYYKAPPDQRFRVTQAGSVEFYLGDSVPGDNTGGVSFRVVSLGETGAPGKPVINSVTPGNGSLTVAFTPSEIGPEATSYTATCSPAQAEAASEAMALYPEDLQAWHESEAFRTGGHRCGANEVQARHQLQGLAPQTISSADCGLHSTADEYNPLSGAYVIPVYWHVTLH